MWQHGHDDSIQDTRAAIYLLFAVAVTSDHFDVEKSAYYFPQGTKSISHKFCQNNTTKQTKQTIATMLSVFSP